MSTNVRQYIFNLVQSEKCNPSFIDRLHDYENEDQLLCDLMKKGESGNEMAIIFLAEWLSNLMKNNMSSTPIYKKLNLFFMLH